MQMRIKTQLILSLGLLLLLLAAVAFVAIDRMERIGHIAGDLNSRVIDKTRVAATIGDLEQQMRFADGFLLQDSDPAQIELARNLIESRSTAVDGQISSYTRLADSDVERSLLKNLGRDRAVYAALQKAVLAASPETRRTEAGANADRLAEAFGQVKRQTKGLSSIAETEARKARAEAEAITEEARWTVLVVAASAIATGCIVVCLMMLRIFRPLARITEALIALSQGRLDVALPSAGRDGAMSDMLRALDVVRGNALALTEAHEEAQAAHRRADLLARHDALTGLPNRRVLATRVEDAIAQGASRGLAAAVLVLDLDRFKPVNDLHGHGAGDKVLCEIALRLEAAIRTGDVAARLGGDEFAVLLQFEPGSDVPHRVARRILASIGTPIATDQRSVTVGGSIGIAAWPTDGGDAESLLRAADLAMLKAKRDGRGSLRFFEAEMDVQLRSRADVEWRIGQAIRGGDIRPHYQPLVDLRANAIVGFEVLARWHDGDVVRPPGDFIAIASEAGLMPELTYAVLRQACRDAREWPDNLTLALNVTPAQISDPRLPQILLSLLREEGFAPSRLELEITEDALIGDVATAKAVMTDLRQHGVRMSLDDFGTGYSSLHHLRDLKFDKLKIDRSFVQAMPTNGEALKIVETILALGRGLGIDVLAEGIETVEHLRQLTDQGCEFGQGFHFGKPLAATAAGRLLDHARAREGALPSAA